MDRPKCRRCGGPLDLALRVSGEPVHLSCNSPHGQHRPIQSDEEFQRAWGDLSGDDVVRLERQLGRGLNP